MVKKTRKIFMVILVGLLALTTVVLAIRAVLNYTSGRKLAAYLEKAKAGGAAMKMKDLVPDCPDSDNAAPLWKAAEALVQAGNNDRGLLARMVQDLFDGKPLDEERRGQLSGLVENNRRALDLLVEASGRTCFRWNDWSLPAHEGQFFGAVKLITATRLLAADAVLRAGRGDTRGALDLCLAGLRFHRLVFDEPYLINGLIAMADLKVCLIAADWIISGRDVEPEVLASWIRELDPRPWRERFGRVLPGERALAVEAGVAITQGGGEVMSRFLGMGRAERLWAWLARPVIKSEIVWVQRRYEALIDMSRKPYHEQAESLTKEAIWTRRLPWYYRFSGAVLSNYEAAFMKEATLEAMMLATRAGLASKIFKMKTGSCPKTLENLVPEYLPGVPVDPFTGQPLVYRLTADELLIYSLGTNAKDDGGRGTYLIDKLVMEKDDDWTWREKVR